MNSLELLTGHEATFSATCRSISKQGGFMKRTTIGGSNFYKVMTAVWAVIPAETAEAKGKSRETMVREVVGRAAAGAIHKCVGEARGVSVLVKERTPPAFYQLSNVGLDKRQDYALGALAKPENGITQALLQNGTGVVSATIPSTVEGESEPWLFVPLCLSILKGEVVFSVVVGGLAVQGDKDQRDLVDFMTVLAPLLGAALSTAEAIDQMSATVRGQAYEMRGMIIDLDRAEKSIAQLKKAKPSDSPKVPIE